MKLQRRALALLLGTVAMMPGVAAAVAPPTAGPPLRAGAAAPPPSNFWVTVEQYIPVNTLIDIGGKVALSLGIFILGWFVAKFASWLVFRALCRTSIDNKLA